MSDYFSFTVELPEDAAELASALLHDLGCLGIEVRDRELKPMPGQKVPEPGHVLLVAFFDGREALEEARDTIANEFSVKAEAAAAVPDEDWSESWKAQIKAVQAGRLWVGPPWLVEQAPPKLTQIVIEPGMAFGTGDHPTTRFCLEALDRFLAARAGVDTQVLDVGTGSGVLAIAARKQGASRVVGTDNDPVAIRVAQENAERNKVTGLEFSTLPLEQVSGPFDLVLANILSNTLIELAPAIVKQLAPGGMLYLAGILEPQADEVLAAYLAQPQRLEAKERLRDGEWSLLGLGRPS
jgi:ribosomal protein L11 methyltransferase